MTKWDRRRIHTAAVAQSMKELLIKGGDLDNESPCIGLLLLLRGQSGRGKGTLWKGLS